MSQLLLRLFQSSHFNIHLAVSYLKTYPDSIGITHYLVARLDDYPEDEIVPFWPQFIHLLLTRATESTAVEDFILNKSRESTHLAMLSLWYLQAALSDLASTPNTPTFDTCRRVLNQVQAVIFADLVAPKPASSASPAASLLGLKPKKKLKPHAKASIAGLGVLASAIAMPALAQTLGPMALAQGRRELEPDHSALFSDQHQHQPVAGPSRHSSDEEDLLESGSRTQFVDAPKTLMSSKSHAALSGGPPLSRSSAAVRPSPLSATRTRFSADHPPRKALTPVSFTNSPSSPALDRTSTSNSSAANRRMVSASTSSLPMPASHSISVPSLPLKDPAPNGPLDVQRALATIPQETLSHLLRSHSCRAQLDLVSSLQDISTRLVNVPKPARVSALRAELTVLNHGLPRGCCIGIICSHSRSSEPHHRVVRICPSESVVLNSADRAPYLIHVEVLEGDLDFDPTRRQNVEDVRHVLQEREEAIAKASSREIHFTSPLPAASQQPSAKSPATVAARSGRAIAQATKGLTLTMKRKGNVDSVDVGEARTPPLSAASATSFTARHASLRPSSLDMPSAEDDGDLGIAISEPQSEERDTRGSDEPMEEMDMVEQLYGDTSLIPEPIAFEGPTLHNRSLDEEAWSRIDSSSHKPNAPPESPELPSAAPAPHSPSKKPITLDEYADRMRMAAIMLSQLSAQENDAALLSSSSVFGLAGAGYEAVRGRLPFVSSKVPTSAAGQGSTGIPAKIDLEGAASGHSSVQGTGSMSPPPAHPGTFNANAIAPSPANTTTPKAKVLSPIETAAIRERIMQEMQALEDERVARMRHDSKARASGWTSGHAPQAVSSSVEDPSLVLSLANKDDPSGVVLSESWPEKIARIRASSPYGHLERWNVFSVIVKTGTDLRQEQLATQLIREFERVWSNAGCPHWLRYFRILVTSESTGLIETITDTMSVHSIKKNAYSKAGIEPTGPDQQQQQLSSYTLYDHFKETFGPPTSSGFRRAQSCFIKSLASYCVVCYLLQIKDRHNGNILIDRYGHIMHIDFGFLLSNSPGQLGFEMAPFKLPQEYIDILGGLDSERFQDFRTLTKQCFGAARKQAESIIMIVELMQKDSSLPCFLSGDQTAQLLRQRFQLSLTQTQCDEFVDRLIDSSAGSVFTRLYDAFQTFSQGIL